MTDIRSDLRSTDSIGKGVRKAVLLHVIHNGEKEAFCVILE